MSSSRIERRLPRSALRARLQGKPDLSDNLSIRLAQEWFLQPVFAVDSEKYLSALTAQNDAASIPAREPFAPLLLKGKSEVTKTLLFLPVEGHADPALLEPGDFQLRFYARDSRSSQFRELRSRKIVLKPEMLKLWRGGQTIAGAQFERPTDPKPLIRAMDNDNNARKE